jgi:hypothetical protein
MGSLEVADSSSLQYELLLKTMEYRLVRTSYKFSIQQAILAIWSSKEAVAS